MLCSLRRESLTAQERRGLEAFEDPTRGNCAACHVSQPGLDGTTPSFSNADLYRGRAASYTKQLKDLQIWAKAEIDTVPVSKRRVLLSHDSMQYLALAYGITMISVNGWTNVSEPSAADLARLTDQIRRDRVKVLFLDSITDPRAMERISKESGAVIGGALYSDALSKPDGPAATYLDMIRHDVSALKSGMLLN